jgi:hypothetical protein
MNNEENNSTIRNNGKEYRYDPDYDCYYRVFTRDEYDALPHWEKYNWLYVSAVLTVIAAIVTYVK